MRFVEDIEANNRILADLQVEIQSEPRTAEPHVSELIYCLTRSWYKRFKPLPSTTRESLLFVVGVGLETVLLRPQRQSFSGVVDGVRFSVDWLEHDGLFGELKSTRISEERPPEELPETWQKQILSYMGARRDGTEALLSVIHLMGNYKPPFPTLKTYRVVATEQEVRDNWKWLLGRRDVFNKSIEEGVPPKQFVYNEDWECPDCPMLLVCQANQSIEDSHGQ